MAYPQASPITLTPKQQLILEQIVRRPTSSQGLVKRVKLLLAAAKGINNTQLSVALQMSRTTVRFHHLKSLYSPPPMASHLAIGGGIKERQSRFALQLPTPLLSSSQPEESKRNFFS
jgi:hypothetical protein